MIFPRGKQVVRARVGGGLRVRPNTMPILVAPPPPRAETERERACRGCVEWYDQEWERCRHPRCLCPRTGAPVEMEPWRVLRRCPFGRW